MKVLRPIGHDDRLSIVDHLDELRTRLMICGAAMLVVFCVCFWQNQALIRVLNRALPTQKSVASHGGLGAEPNQAAILHHDLRLIGSGASQLERSLANVKGISPSDLQGLHTMSAAAFEAANHLPKSTPTQEKPLAIGVGESFTTTLLVVLYFTLLFSLPLLLYELYAFIIPALNPTEKRAALPVMFLAPLLFIAGAVFTYFMVLPPAVHFLQGYNSKEFTILVQGKTYYKFEMLIMLGIGLAFQLPLVLLALQRIGVITARTLTGNWRYAVVIIAVIVAALPGVDPVTMFFETLPLLVLYLVSIVALHINERRMAKREAAELAASAQGLDAT
ncbi:MAG TPA: twin-arginine translocase subunit TatC [Solirubrobacteraceae bacterium]|nr:twin-arginine translocase subunit TatC [Solirubrobacteraceae bacterium]